MCEILTLNSRSYVLLEVVKNYFGLNTAQIKNEILTLHKETVVALKKKGVIYSQLKSALVPKTDKFEAAFIFDSRLINSYHYGMPVFRAFMPLLDKMVTQSVRVGDCLGSDQKFIQNVIESSIFLCRELNYQHSSDYYCIYINNLSQHRIDLIHQGLSDFTGYIGYIPATQKPIVRFYLSTTLMSFFLKTGTKIITSHELDRLDHENVNIGGYPFDEFGYSHISIREDYFEMFLNYKIERPQLRNSDFDSEMALSSMSESYIPIEKCTLIIRESRYKYLIERKFGSLERAGLANGDINDLKKKIKEKIISNYIYNMNNSEEHNVMKFNLILEFVSSKSLYPIRLLSVFTYRPIEKEIELITMY